MNPLLELRIKEAAQRGLSKSTRYSINLYGRLLPPRVEDLTVEGLQKIRDEIEAQDWKPQTQRHALDVILTIVRLGIRRGLLPRELKLDFPRIRAPLSVLPTCRPKEFEKMLASTTERQSRLALLLGYDAGLRAREVRDLQKRDVHLSPDEDYLLVRFGKGGRSRLVPILTERLREALTLCCEGKAPEDHIAMRGNADPHMEHTIDLRHVCERAGVRNLGFHSLRHGFAYWAATEGLDGRGANIDAIRRMLGHASLSMTQRYLEATGADVNSLRKAFGYPNIITKGG